MKSVLQNNKECWVCGDTNVCCHHVFYGTANRKKSDKLGMTVWLCPQHHNMSNEGVHFNKLLDLSLKRFAQEYFEKNIGDRLTFINEFGRSWL